MTTRPEVPERELYTVRARTVKEFCRAYGVGKTTAYELIDQGKVLTVKVGRRTLVDEASAQRWYKALPRARAYYGT